MEIHTVNKDYIKKYNILPAVEKRFLQLVSLLTHEVEYYILREYFFSISPLLNKVSDIKLTSVDILELIKKYKKIGIWSKHTSGVLPELGFYLTQQSLSPDNSSFKENIEFINKFVPKNDKQIGGFLSSHKLIQFVNLSLHLNDTKLFELFKYSDKALSTACNNLLKACELNSEWVESRDIRFQALICAVKLEQYNNLVKPDGYSTNEFKTYVDLYKKNNNFIRMLLPNFVQTTFLRIDLLAGNLIQLSERNESTQTTDLYILLQKSLLAIIQNDFKGAIKLFDKTWSWFEGLDPNNHRINLLCQPELTFLYAIGFIATKNYTRYASSILKPLDRNGKHHLSVPYEVLALVNDCDFEAAKTELKTYKHNNLSLMQYAVYSWVNYLVNNTNDSHPLKTIFELSVRVENKLAAHLLAELICIELKQTDYQSFLESSPFGKFRIGQILQVKQIWEHTIEKLESFIIHNNPSTEPTSRLLWILRDGKIGLHEQNMLKNGAWSTIKDIGPTRLQKILDTKHTFSESDSKALNGVSYDRYYGVMIRSDVIFALVDAPNIFLHGNPPTRVELVAGQVQLNVTKVKDGYKLKLNYCYTEAKIIITKESSTRYLVINYTENTANIARIIGSNGIIIPATSKERVLNLVYNANSNIKIQADFEDDNIVSIPANNNRTIQLVPQDDGLHVSLLFQPFLPYEAGYFYPAIGQSTLVCTSESGVRQKVARDIKLEAKLAKEIVDNCPSLSGTQDYTWTFSDLESSLEVLDELSECKNRFADLEIQWPKGQTLSVRKKITHDSFSLRIKASQNYFEYDGTVKLDDGKVISMKFLLSLLENAPQKKFVKLDDGSFVTLSDNFRSQLAELNQVSHGNKIFNLTSDSLQNLADATSDVQLDKSWNEHIKRLSNINKHNPEVPSTLQTQLRDYQIDGFKYLSRLANWHIGICLADDMGLGKTVQTIALILERAHNGATLIIAPTSVCFNWVNELEKFAPTLNIYIAYDIVDRSTQIAKMKAMDVLICSYGLLGSLEDILIAKEWQILILDEAQSIKNSNTKRWSVVSKLNSSVRIALTGTPIENHLGELWSIFHFLNPGLLGTLKHFQNKFITPISNSNQVAKTALKNIVKPYILRRTKSEVLTELPAKIEKSIIIEPSADEMAFYEAIKQKSLEKLNNLDGTNKRISILAELTKLRQACCHSTLIDPEINLSNSKLEAFIELVLELRANNHKALIFSQYVRYLQIVKAELERNGFTYQYIDGSTAVSNRKKAVAEFQSGSSDVFLISLKAGGTGLNLTAADYVVILDPWWNPAVEDQAAGRAHRIGQLRPVTVYRLITKNTIEEKIIKLHQDKRDLAGDLLEGQDIGGKLTDDDLLALIR